VYKAAGFTHAGDTKPGYVWVQGRRVLSRHETMKHKLPGLLKDFDPALSERENMEHAGWCQVFDAGHQRWEWHKYHKY
jgi:hypothetical protein